MRVLATTLGALTIWCAPAGAIVGGEPVPEGQLRAVANVHVALVGGCSGTLIAPTWVMTAAHCGSATAVATGGAIPGTTPMPAAAYTVVLDTVHADGRGGEEHGVKRVVIAEDYGVAEGAGSDVALLELDNASKVAPIQIAAVGERDLWRPADMTTIAGFGLTEQDGEPPDRMQRAQVPIVTDADCRAAYPEFDAATMLCAGYPQGGTDTCQGDSGGPLLADAGGTPRLVGSTSFGDGCAQAGKPGVYARIAEGKLREFVKKLVPDAFAPEPKESSPPTQPSSQPAATPAKRPSKAACRKARKVKKRCGDRRTERCRKARRTVRRCR